MPNDDLIKAIKGISTRITSEPLVVDAEHPDWDAGLGQEPADPQDLVDEMALLLFIEVGNHPSSWASIDHRTRDLFYRDARRELGYIFCAGYA